MSKVGKKSIFPNRNKFVDRQIFENETFPEAVVQLETIDSILLLLDSQEDAVLITILKHLTEFIRRNDGNIALLKEKNVLEQMLRMEYFRFSKNVVIRRFSLYLVSAIVEAMNTLVELEPNKAVEIVKVFTQYYLDEDDDFCLEYLSVAINRLVNDPKVSKIVVKEYEFVEKLNEQQTSTSNPDIILHSFELMEKMLMVLGVEELQEFIARPSFPISRILCELTAEFMEIRKAALGVLRILVMETKGESPLRYNAHKVYVLEQLTKMFCDNVAKEEELKQVLEVLACALRNDELAQLFFELNLFERFMAHLNNGELDADLICKAMMVLTEAANYQKYLPRLATAEVTEKLVVCLLTPADIPVTHTLLGLNRMMKNQDACNRVFEAFDLGIVKRLLSIMIGIDLDIKAREQAAILLLNLLLFGFYRTANEMLDLKGLKLLGNILGQDPQYLSTDLLLTMFNIIDCLADNCDYRQKVCEDEILIKNIAILLMNSFSTTVVVNNIFRSLCILVDEAQVRTILLENYLTSSIKRALQSLSNVLKTTVTNFIMQTSRYQDLVEAYIDNGVLEVLILHQKHAFCVPTWVTAIDSILSRNPTLKFCIRNHLSFTDITKGQDLFISKEKFDDFRTFQCLLRNEVSPLHPVLVVNFDRPEAPEENIVKVPRECLSADECRQQGGEWCYCRTPGDRQLPLYLEEVITNLEEAGLSSNPTEQKRCIDFENVARRAKIISQVVARVLSSDLTPLDLNSTEECSQHAVKCHLKELARELHCTYIPLGRITTGCQFERAILFKALADQVGLPCTLQRSVDGRMLFNELPLPLEMAPDIHCDPKTMALMPWRMLRPTHIVDLMYNVGELYAIQSRQALQYLRLY